MYIEHMWFLGKLAPKVGLFPVFCRALVPLLSRGEILILSQARKPD